MDPLDTFRATAQEVVSFARGQGVDLEPLRKDFTFQRDGRWIDLWRKLDSVPGTGRPDEKEGTLKYNMQGTIGVLPNVLPRESEGAFRGMWTEAGTLDGVEEAFALVKAWLLDGNEVDDLPGRHVRRCGI